MSEPRTLIIVPAFNEELALPGVLEELAAIVQHDVLVVDDGSTDRTAEIARDAGVTLVMLPFNLGVGGALRTGFRFALRFGYERAVQFDADGQHDAREIKKLLEGLDEGADLVIGSRFASAETGYEVKRIRGGAMKVLRLLVQAISGQRFTDTSSGFRAFRRPVIEHFARTYPEEYLGDTVEALLLAVYEGFEVVEVPARMSPRTEGPPSNRNLKLIYQYLRLLVVIATTITFKARKWRKKTT